MANKTIDNLYTILEADFSDDEATMRRITGICASFCRDTEAFNYLFNRMQSMCILPMLSDEVLSSTQLYHYRYTMLAINMLREQVKTLASYSADASEGN